MAGEHADHDLPKFGDDDDDSAESTVAMESPSFDPVALGVSSPISEPPPPPSPAAPAAVAAPPLGGRQSPHTAPVPFTPVGAAGPAVPPTMGRAKAPSSPLVPTPLGGLVPRPVGAEPNPSGLSPAAPPLRAGAVGAFGVSGRVRPQTVIGLAPPPPGAPRPGAPVAPPRQQPSVDAAPGMRPSEPGARAASSKAGSPSANDLPSWSGDADHAHRAKEARGAPDSDQGLFGLDASAAEAARAAVAAPGPRPVPGAARSPSASQAHTDASPVEPPSQLPSLDTKPPKGSDPEAATVAVPREQLRSAGSTANPVQPQAQPHYDEDDTTHARRGELPRLHDAHVVVGDDVGGDDATLAVPLGDSEAKNKQLGAFAQTLAQEGSGFGSPPGPFAEQRHSHPGGPMTPPQSSSAPQPGGWNDPHQQQWNPAASSSSPMRAMGQGHERPSDPLPISSPYLMGMPESASHPGVSRPGVSHPGGSRPGVSHPGRGVGPGPMGMPMHQQPMQGQLSYHGQHGQHGPPMMQGQPAQWAAPARRGPRLKISGQIVLLAVVGVICLTIFITGIVLFATTKF